MLTRRLALIAALAFSASVAAAAPAKKLAPQPGDMSLGSPRARVQVVEYASLSCSHCADFHRDVFPAFKKKYVDSGKVRFTFREMLTPPANVAAAGYFIARCAGPAKYFKVVGEVFDSQPRWNDGDVRGVLLQIAKQNGLSEPQFEACLSDEASQKAINARVQSAIDLGVNATPTFFINGRKLEGVQSLQQLDAAIAAAAG